MPFVIDGYNLLKAVQKSFETFENISELHMCKLISELMNKMQSQTDIVFDGFGPSDKSDFENFDRISIHFSGSKEADDIIEIIIKKNSAPKKLNVISDDRRLITAAKRRKASPLDCLNFWIFLIDQLQKKPKVKEPLSKQTGLTKKETDQWMKEFGLE